MAPEMIKGLGYTKLIDLWGLGILLFEFMCGFVPFGEEEEDPYHVYKMILEEGVDFPEYFDTPENHTVKNFILKLLNKVPEARLSGSFASLKSHGWFEDFPWGKLSDEIIPAPFIPKNRNTTKEEID